MNRYFSCALVFFLCSFASFSIAQKQLLLDALSDASYYPNLQKPLSDHQNSLKDSISRVIIVCPSVVTGGPENLCQLSYQLQQQGFEVYLLWCFENCVIKELCDGVWYLNKQHHDYTPLYYKEKYNIRYVDRDIPLDQQTLVIVPEIWTDYIFFFEQAQKAIAWLSVSNMYNSGRSKVMHHAIFLKRVDALPIVHLAQAEWIEKTIQGWGGQSYLLGDYIADVFRVTPALSSKEGKIAYNPARGKALINVFTSEYPDDSYIVLQGLTQLGMIEALDKASVYIDFGHFPGKDRTPREALLRGCIIFIHNNGCATDYDSFPIPDYFRFSADDVTSGVLHDKVMYCLAHYEEMFELQKDMLSIVQSEHETFDVRVSTIFGTPKIN